MIAKAPGLDADMVFLDLEDACAPSEKAEARQRVAAALGDLDWGDKVVGVRVNAWDSAWTVRDALALVGADSERLDVVVLPKTQCAAEVVALDLLLSQLEAERGRRHRIGIEVQIETATGLLHVEEICAASARLETVAFGPADFAASVEMPVLTGGGAVPGYPGDHFHYVLARILVAGRANGLQVLDGPYLKIRDTEGLLRSSVQSAALGYDGKWALHPTQLGVVNGAFTPSQEQFDRAHDILEAYHRSTTEDRRGAAMYGDEMIDEASAKMARKFIARGERAGLARTAPGAPAS
jgi:citrate lyase subunit beta/citryl-CoA lyase